MKLGVNVTLYHLSQSNLCDMDQEIGDNTKIHSHVWIGNGVKIGKNCLIQAFSFIPEGVTIEDNVFIGPHVCFTNDKNPPSADWASIIVKKGASIGANATILPGLTIGENSRVGAGSTVTHDVPDGETWAGNPARKL